MFFFHVYIYTYIYISNFHSLHLIVSCSLRSFANEWYVRPHFSRPGDHVIGERAKRARHYQV